MREQDILWVIGKIRRAIAFGRAAQAYALAVALAHFAGGQHA